jgi:23S rRNA pseudouridine2604 synthase
MSVSLNKFISSQGICSRREADRIIEEGRVLINGKIAKRGNRVEPDDKVVLDGKNISQRQKTKGKKTKKHTYLIFNKPRGIITTTDLREPANVISYIDYHKRIFPVGRLDKDSEGLLLMTDDGEIVNHILRAKHGHEKEYIVSVNKPLEKEFVEKMQAPMKILGQKILPVKVERLGRDTFNIILTQGLNRQIRRMCNNLGYKVKTLQRVRLMNLYLGDLPVGKWRYINASELARLKSLIEE